MYKLCCAHGKIITNLNIVQTHSCSEICAILLNDSQASLILRIIVTNNVPVSQSLGLPASAESTFAAEREKLCRLNLRHAVCLVYPAIANRTDQSMLYLIYNSQLCHRSSPSDSLHDRGGIMAE